MPPDKMARATKETEQHHSLWKQLQTEALLKTIKDEFKVLCAREMLKF